MLDRSGRSMGRLSYVRRINVPLGRVPRYVRAAFIATEDRRFYDHAGIDWRSAGRATWRNLTSLSVREGFSTITMQVVRNAFIPHMAGSRSLRRKLIELHLAGRLERALSKQQILELYLNVIYLGNGTYGVEAASRDLFGKSVEKLSLAEAATLAALPKGPSVYAPRRHAERARERRNLVLSLMAREGFITREQAERAARSALVLARTEWYPARDRSYALDAVRAFVDSVLGDDLAEVGDVSVHTALDADAQTAAERSVRNQAAAIERATGQKRDPLEGVLIALDPRSGEIRALVGGRNFTRQGFNRAIAARRQPGSAFKPFVYATAMAAGFTPASVIDDSPVQVAEEGRIWRPANFGNEYGGPLTLRHALMRSANAATVRLSQAVGERRIIALARQVGIESPMAPLPSVALGALEVTPLELVTAYAPFANGGLRVHPELVRRIVTAEGTVLWSAKSEPAERVLDERDAFQVTSMLQAVVTGGTGSVLREMGVRGPVAGKTGTTNDGTDVWFVGYTPTLVAAVWFGYDSPRPIARNASGGRLAAPAWAAFYTNGWHESEDEDGWDPPAGMVSRVIDSENGELAGEWCPTTHREWFKTGTEPTETCRDHPAPLFERIEAIGRAIGRAIGKIFDW